MKQTYTWGQPGNARKWHLFAHEDTVSACGRWLYRNPDPDPTQFDPKATTNKDDCAACIRKANKR